jgi:hypothetical protein
MTVPIFVCDVTHGSGFGSSTDDSVVKILESSLAGRVEKKIFLCHDNCAWDTRNIVRKRDQIHCSYRSESRNTHARGS